MNQTHQDKLPPTESLQVSFAQTYAGQDPQFLVINGPNLNMLGKRDPEIYGSITLAEITALLEVKAAALGVSIFSAQSNNEGEMIDLIHKCRGYIKGIIINPGAWAHTSLALADALPIAGVPIVEVHLSNIYAREPFRHHSYVSAVSQGVISGLGEYGYIVALEYLASRTL